jgi:hypothetical protein
LTEIRHIVFDIGKVLIHYDPDLAYRDLIPDPENRRWFLETVTRRCWSPIFPTTKPTSAPSGRTGTRWCRTPMTTASPFSKR